VIRGVIEIIYDVGLAFSQLFQDTKSGGEDWGATIKEVIGETVDAFKNVIAAVVFVADAFIATWDLITAAGNNFLANWKEQTGQIEVLGVGLGEFMKVVGKVVEDALTLHWGAIAADWDAGMQHVHDVVLQKTNEILATTAHLRQQAQSDFDAAMNLGKSFDAFQKNLFSTTAPKPRRLQVQVRRWRRRCAGSQPGAKGSHKKGTSWSSSSRPSSRRRRPPGPWSRTLRARSNNIPSRARPTFGPRR
jgi:hypothetical protein